MQHRPIKGLRWWIVGLVVLGMIFNYLARSSLAVAAPTLTQKLHLSTQQYSYIVTAFQAAYALAQPVAGFVIDLVGLKIGFAIFAVCRHRPVLRRHLRASGALRCALHAGFRCLRPA